jgi:hypothetical protein
MPFQHPQHRCPRAAAEQGLSVRQAVEAGPLGTGVGALVGGQVGGQVGLLGGPVGVAIKTKLLEQRAATAIGDAKARLDLRISELRAERERRSGLLEQAWALTKEAFEPR